MTLSEKMHQAAIRLLERFGGSDLRLEAIGRKGKFRYFASTRSKSHENGEPPQAEVGNITIK